MTTGLPIVRTMSSSSPSLRYRTSTLSRCETRMTVLGEPSSVEGRTWSSSGTLQMREWWNSCPASTRASGEGSGTSTSGWMTQQVETGRNDGWSTTARSTWRGRSRAGPGATVQVAGLWIGTERLGLAVWSTFLSVRFLRARGRSSARARAHGPSQLDRTHIGFGRATVPSR